jgi:hypothetical protein
MRLQRAKGSRARRDPENNLGVEMGQSEEKDTGLENSESDQAKQRKGAKSEDKRERNKRASKTV